jgi:hypothetical protein
MDCRLHPFRQRIPSRHEALQRGGRRDFLWWRYDALCAAHLGGRPLLAGRISSPDRCDVRGSFVRPQARGVSLAGLDLLRCTLDFTMFQDGDRDQLSRANPAGAVDEPSFSLQPLCFILSVALSFFRPPGFDQHFLVLICSSVRKYLPTPEQLKHRIPTDCSRLPGSSSLAARLQPKHTVRHRMTRKETSQCQRH